MIFLQDVVGCACVCVCGGGGRGRCDFSFYMYEQDPDSLAPPFPPRQGRVRQGSAGAEVSVLKGQNYQNIKLQLDSTS